MKMYSLAMAFLTTFAIYAHAGEVSNTEYFNKGDASDFRVEALSLATDAVVTDVQEVENCMEETRGECLNYIYKKVDVVHVRVGYHSYVYSDMNEFPAYVNLSIEASQFTPEELALIKQQSSSEQVKSLVKLHVTPFTEESHTYDHSVCLENDDYFECEEKAKTHPIVVHFSRIEVSVTR